MEEREEMEEREVTEKEEQVEKEEGTVKEEGKEEVLEETEKKEKISQKESDGLSLLGFSSEKLDKLEQENALLREQVGRLEEKLEKLLGAKESSVEKKEDDESDDWIKKVLGVGRELPKKEVASLPKTLETRVPTEKEIERVVQKVLREEKAQKSKLREVANGIVESHPQMRPYLERVLRAIDDGEITRKEVIPQAFTYLLGDDILRRGKIGTASTPPPMSASPSNRSKKPVSIEDIVRETKKELGKEE